MMSHLSFLPVDLVFVIFMQALSPPCWSMFCLSRILLLVGLASHFSAHYCVALTSHFATLFLGHDVELEKTRTAKVHYGCYLLCSFSHCLPFLLSFIKIKLAMFHLSCYPLDLAVVIKCKFLISHVGRCILLPRCYLLFVCRPGRVLHMFLLGIFLHAFLCAHVIWQCRRSQRGRLCACPGCKSTFRLITRSIFCFPSWLQVHLLLVTRRIVCNCYSGKSTLYSQLVS